MNTPRLSFWQIWNMSFGFLGIQFGWGLQMANMSPIYKYLGATDDQIPLLWLAAPLTGFIVQPIIGAMSDRTWGPLGRRRPYFLVGAILSSLALVASWAACSWAWPVCAPRVWANWVPVCWSTLVAEKIGGSAHFANGNSLGMGGKNDVPIHIDWVVPGVELEFLTADPD